MTQPSRATIAIIGRPNVGKSTLFNRIVGRKQAIVDDQPGVTRDRKMGYGNIGPLDVDVIDTPGLETTEEDSLQGRMFLQSMQAIEEADLALLVFDAKDGITPRDEFFAKIIRRLSIPVVLVANKAEGRNLEGLVAEGYRLGFGAPVALSAEHGEGMIDLYEAITEHVDDPEPEDAWGEESASEEEDPNEPLGIAIVGRPNVGKSTLMNAILGEERMLTGPDAGVTRDAIMVKTEYKGVPLRLVDTAGMRRKSRIDERVERMSVSESTHAIRFANIVVLVLDATQPLEKQDNTIAALIEREGRGCVVALNKWDLVPPEKKDALLEELRYKLGEVMPQMKGITLVPISAVRSKNLDKLFAACQETYALWNFRVGTSDLNRWLDEALMTHTPPMIKGRRFKVRYITQAKSRPPSFVLFINRHDKAIDSYIRYLVGSLRDTFKLPGVPIRMMLRTGKNPYVKEE